MNVCVYVYTVAVYVSLRIPRDPDAEVVAVSAANVRYQVGRLGEAALHLLPGLTGRRVPTQGQDVADSRLLAFLQHLFRGTLVFKIIIMCSLSINILLNVYT